MAHERKYSNRKITSLMTRKTLTLTLLFLLLVPTSLAQAPRLALFLTVEELRSDLLEEFLDELPEGGLRRLAHQGVLYPYLHHPLTTADATASQAIIHTGTLATANGIPERRPTLRTSHHGRTPSESVFEDQNHIGRGTPERRSPLALTAPTIADQLKQSSNGLAIVYSVAPNAEEAIIAGGQLANGAFWIDDFTGNWTSTTYYTEGLPWYVERNSFVRTNADSRPHYKTTHEVNGEILHVAKTLLTNSLLGKDNTTDLLALHLYAGAPLGTPATTREEHFAIYWYLNHYITEFLKELDRQLGSDNYVVILAGNSMTKAYAPLSVSQRTFHPDRTKALINMYLIAQYGQQNWVEDITPRGELFLNRELIKATPGLSLPAIQDEVADFLLEFSGIQFAIADHRLRTEAIGKEKSALWQTALNKSTHKHRGDVLFELLPGWVVEQAPGQEGDTPYRMASTHAPLILYAPKLEQNVVTTPLDLREVSQKVCHLLRLPPPAGTHF